MRKLFLPLLGAAGLATFIAGAALRHESAPPASPPALPASAAVAELPPPATEKAPPTTAAPSVAASSPAPGAGAPSAPTVAAEAPPVAAPPPTVSDLPTVEVATHTVHAVPEEDAPMMPVTVRGRDGHVLATFRSPSAQPQHQMPAPPPFNGVARVVDDTVLDVLGRPVRLFGVRPPAPRDRCALPDGSAQPCREVAREALAQRLAGSAEVHCRVPPGQRGTAAAICLDGRGTDLGGFLVAEGFALADSAASYDYVGAESIARSFHRGLWHYR